MGWNIVVYSIRFDSLTQHETIGKWLANNTKQKGLITMTNLNQNLYTVEQMADTRWVLRFNEKNQKGESLLIELSLCQDDPTWKNSNPKVWYKNGYTDMVLETYWSIDVEVEDSEGISWRKYDIQSKLSEDKKRLVINFDWILEATEENKNILINEVYRLFINATGKSVTEEKREKVIEYAKMNDLEVVTEVPEGWLKKEYATDPFGSISVCNTKWSLKAIKAGTYQRKLLLV